MTIAAAVLAAGAGTRLDSGEPKPLLQLRGVALVTWALDAALESGLAPVLLVVGASGDAVAELAPGEVHVVRAAEWEQGIAHSLHAALDELEGDPATQALCVGLADQPGIGAEAYRRLAATHRDGATLAVATYGGQRANPVLLDRSLWPAARRLRGDVGARALMADVAVVEVDCTGTGDPRDVDTLEDLRALEERGDAS